MNDIKLEIGQISILIGMGIRKKEMDMDGMEGLYMTENSYWVKKR